MKKFLLFLGKLLLWAVALVLLLVIVVIAGTAAGLPSGACLTIFFVIVVIGAAVIICKRLINRAKAKQRVNELTNEEGVAGSGDDMGFLGFGGSPFVKQFKESLKVLRQSELSAKGDPVYALPWYLMIGSDHSGKSSALKNAKLPAPIQAHMPKCSFSWELYNQAIVLDMPGQLTNQEGNSDWKQLLKCLSKHRRKEPINGVVVTVSAESLMSMNADELVEMGRQNRARVYDVMKGLKIKVPVYMLITKLDSIPGFSTWAKGLPEETLSQALGYAQIDNDLEAEVFIPKALDTMIDRIKAFMLVGINQYKADPELLRMPNLLEELAGKLDYYAKGAFQKTPYQDTPFLRGVYLSGALDIVEDEKPRTLGLFLHEFFTEIMPSDRKIISTLTSAEKADALTRRLALSGWGIAVAVIVVLMSIGYFSNKASLHRYTLENAGKFTSQETDLANLHTMLDMHEMVGEFESNVDGWMMPWFAYQEPDFFQKLRNNFNASFKHTVLKAVDEDFDKTLNRLMIERDKMREQSIEFTSKDDKRTAQYVQALSRRINVLQRLTDTEQTRPTFDELMEMPAPFVSREIFLQDFNTAPVVANLNKLYIASLAWQEDVEPLENDLKAHRTQLQKLLRSAGADMSWVLTLASYHNRGDAVRISNFWAGTGGLKDSWDVPGAFTLKGHAFIDGFLNDLQATSPTDNTIATMIADFRENYRQQYYDHWETFAMNFHRGKQTLRNRGEWVNMIDQVGSDENPFITAIQTIAEQLAPIVENEEKYPEWVDMVLFFETMQAFDPNYNAKAAKKKNNFIIKQTIGILKALGLKDLAGSVAGINKTRKKSAKAGLGGGPDKLENVEDAGELLGAYGDALKAVAFAASSKEASFNALSNIFTNPEAAGEGEDPVAQLYFQIGAMEKLIGKRTEYNAAFWELYGGPRGVILDYLVQESASYLQDEWIAKVMAQTDGVPEHKVQELLYTPATGLIWTYINGPAKPFIAKQFQKGYLPVQLEGRRIPFTPDFVELVTRGGDAVARNGKDFKVRLSSLPFRANTSAKYQPKSISIRLRHDEGDQMFHNYNFQNSKELTWNSSHGDVVLSIQIGRITLEKTWLGPTAFAEFLKAFEHGSERFAASDFPAYKNHLKQMGVEYIDLQLGLEGHQAVIKTLTDVPMELPEKIVSIWGR